MQLTATDTFITTDAVLFDSLYVVGVKASNQAKFNTYIVNYINEAYRHFKPIGFRNWHNLLQYVECQCRARNRFSYR